MIKIGLETINKGNKIIMENKITFLQFLAAMALAIAVWHILDLLYSMFISPGIPF